MNKKLKNEKERKINPKSHITLHISNNSGITLVALIITIIVLLILAVVAISTVSETGIIGKAKESQTAYNQAQANEQTMIGNYETYIENNLPEENGKKNNPSEYMGNYYKIDIDGKVLVALYLDSESGFYIENTRKSTIEQLVETEDKITITFLESGDQLTLNKTEDKKLEMTGENAGIFFEKCEYSEISELVKNATSAQ